VARIYLDHNATTPVRPEAADAVRAALETPGNPSSIHEEGRAARKVVEAARQAVAALVGADPRCVTFTSGGTEALNLALAPEVELGGDKRRLERLLVCAVEHPAVLAGHRFASETVSVVPVDRDGRLDLGALAAMLAESPASRPMLALQAINNETGVVQPVAEAAALVHAQGGVVVVDAVQAVGRVPVSIAALGADLLALSGHKFGAPKGIGALVRAHDGIHLPNRLVRGGGQESGYRGGTENVPGIAGLGAAATAAGRDLPRFAALGALRDRLEAGLRALCADTVVFGAAAPRVPNTTLFAVPGVPAELALIALDLAGVAVSAGSACSSGKMRRSQVLDAMGVAADLTRGALRVSSGWTTEAADIDRFLGAWADFLGGFSRSEGRVKAA
jgi:cysteine desulfurase